MQLTELSVRHLKTDAKQRNGLDLLVLIHFPLPPLPNIAQKANSAAPQPCPALVVRAAIFSDHSPTRLSKFLTNDYVTLLIASQLALPKQPVSGRNTAVNRTAVPEAAINKYG